MKTILGNAGNRKAFNACIRKNRRHGAVLRASFSVYDYAWPKAKAGSYGPAFYVGRTESYLPKPNEPRARVRIRVYPKGGYISTNKSDLPPLNVDEWGNVS